MWGVRGGVGGRISVSIVARSRTNMSISKRSKEKQDEVRRDNKGEGIEERMRGQVQDLVCEKG